MSEAPLSSAPVTPSPGHPLIPPVYEPLAAREGRTAEALRVRRIGGSDLAAALRAGIDDFAHQPSQIVFLMLIYPIVGLFLARAVLGHDIAPLLFPLAAGFALLGPFAAVGLYEISRRREAGLDHGWRYAFDVLRSPSIGAIAMLGLVLMVIFLAWLVTAMAIYRLTLGFYAPDSLSAFAQALFGTRQGLALIALGNGVGFLFALLTLSLSAVSFPLLVDRPVGLACAVRTSLAAMRANPGPMLAWGLIVAVALLLGALPAFIGLAVVLPVLGHATWHLYRRIVV